MAATLQESMERGIYIPACIWHERRLTARQKLLFGVLATYGFPEIAKDIHHTAEMFHATWMELREDLKALLALGYDPLDAADLSTAEAGRAALAQELGSWG